MMKTSVRGMAKISVLWTIVVLVAFIVAIVAFYLTAGELENQKKAVEAANVENKRLTAKNTADSGELITFSEFLGYYDQAKSNKSDLTTAKASVDQLRKDLPEVLDPNMKTVQSILPALQSAIKTQKDRATELDTQLKTKLTEIDELQKSLRTTVEGKEKELADLRRQLTDSDDQKKALQEGYERQVTDLRKQVKDTNATLTEARGTIEANQRTFANESEAQRTRMSELGRQLNPIVKEPQAADGKVLAVSKDLGLGWIDLGAKNRLPRGTRFTVVSGVQGSTRVKAMAEVTDVKGDMAEVAFSDQRDPFDPPTTGDIIFNPVYDPRGQRNVLLVGAFSGQYGEDQLKNLLASMGITVQKKLDAATDFLIVGSEMYTDENKQPVETPIQPSDLPVFKEAVAQGAQIVLLKDLRNYFRF